MNDMVHHPSHYVDQSATIEPIDILRYAPFDLGNALKYLIRAGHKDDEKQDLDKALVYIEWAQESASIDTGPYIKFFDRYGLLLEKFKAVGDLGVEFGCLYSLQKIEDQIIARLYRINEGATMTKEGLDG